MLFLFLRQSYKRVLYKTFTVCSKTILKESVFCSTFNFLSKKGEYRRKQLEIKTTSKLVVCTDPRGVSTCWPLEGVLKNIIASFALLLVNQFSLVLHSILRERHFSRKSPSSFQLLCTILFPLKDERFFCFFLLPRLFYLPLVDEQFQEERTEIKPPYVG